MDPSQATPKPAASDFTGDRKSDILWHHATRGEVWLWPMDGAARTAETYVRTVAEPGWEIRGLGDQTGDGKADMLWRHAPTGMLYLWTMNGQHGRGGDVRRDGGPGVRHRGDGRLQRRREGRTSCGGTSTNGELWMWLMNGAATLSADVRRHGGPGVRGAGVGRPERRREGRHRLAARDGGRRVGVADERGDADVGDVCGDGRRNSATRSSGWRTTRATGRRTSCGTTRRAAKCGCGR